MRNSLKFLFLVLLLGCSRLTKNRIVPGELVLYGGVKGDQVWKDKWEFKRISWYHEMTMWLDLNMAELTPESPFFAWASPDEQKLIRSCKRFFMAIAYAQDSQKLSEKDMIHQLDRQGMSQVLVPRLANTISVHPDFDRLGLDRHHLWGLCQKGPDLPVVLDFPAFINVTL